MISREQLSTETFSFPKERVVRLGSASATEAVKNALNMKIVMGNQYWFDYQGKKAHVQITETEMFALPEVAAYLEWVHQTLITGSSIEEQVSIFAEHIDLAAEVKLILRQNHVTTIGQLRQLCKTPQVRPVLARIDRTVELGVVNLTRLLIEQVTLNPAELDRAFDMYSLMVLSESKLILAGFDNDRLHDAREQLKALKRQKLR